MTNSFVLSIACPLWAACLFGLMVFAGIVLHVVLLVALITYAVEHPDTVQPYTTAYSNE